MATRPAPVAAAALLSARRTRPRPFALACRCPPARRGPPHRRCSPAADSHSSPAADSCPTATARRLPTATAAAPPVTRPRPRPFPAPCRALPAPHRRQQLSPPPPLPHSLGARARLHLSAGRDCPSPPWPAPVMPARWLSPRTYVCLYAGAYPSAPTARAFLCAPCARTSLAPIVARLRAPACLRLRQRRARGYRSPSPAVQIH